MSILGVRVVKVSHADAILQLVALLTLPHRNTLKLKFGIFIFGQFFCQVAARAHVSRCG